MRIVGRDVGPDRPPLVIAEIGVNHDGSPERALALVDAAAHARADAVKVQVFQADLLLGARPRLAAYQQAAGESDPRAMLRRLELPLEALAAVARRAHERGLLAVATVFSLELVAPSAALGFDCWKTASPDIIHRPLLEALAGTGLPLIVSTGAATLDEVQRAVGWLEGARPRLALLQCVSAYPTPEPDASLAGVAALSEATGLPVGYSDHTQAEDTGALAVAAGACILEKHLTHGRAAAGPDHAASLDPPAFARYADLVRRAHAMLGPPAKRLLPVESDVRAASRQSLTALRDLPAGARLAPADLAVRRPGTGLPPFALGSVLGRALRAPLAAGEALTEAHLA